MARAPAFTASELARATEISRAACAARPEDRDTIQPDFSHAKVKAQFANYMRIAAGSTAVMFLSILQNFMRACCFAVPHSGSSYVCADPGPHVCSVSQFAERGGRHGAHLH